MSRPYTWDLHQSGATDGQVVTWDDALGMYVAADAPGGAPSGAAGGVLSGTYPNPGFADDMATQAELDAVEATIPVLASQLSTAYMPLTTVVGGVPDLVWDGDDSLIPTEVPL